MDAVVTAGSVSKKYGETTALADVSLSISRGEIFALLRPNGAGKTTFVQVLTGTTRPDSGTVSLLGSVPRETDMRQISLLPQSFTPPECLTARELLQYYAGLYETTRDTEAVLADLNLTESADTRYANLSGGQQRRVCVGIAILNDPTVLFLDEPTTGIDPAGRHALWWLLRDLVARGKTIVLTTHYMDEAETLADRVALLSEGTLTEVGSPAELIDTYGGEMELRIETTIPPGELPDLPFPAEQTASGIRVPGVEPQDIGSLVKTLDQQGVAYDSLNWTEPTLEDVYLTVAGETEKQGYAGLTSVSAGGET